MGTMISFFEILQNLREINAGYQEVLEYRRERIKELEDEVDYLKWVIRQSKIVNFPKRPPNFHENRRSRKNP